MARACAASTRALVDTADARRLDLLMDAPSSLFRFRGTRTPRFACCDPFKLGNRLLTQALGGDPWYRARVPLARAWRAADVYLQSAHEPPPFVSGPPHVAMVHDVAFMRPGAGGVLRRGDTQLSRPCGPRPTFIAPTASWRSPNGCGTRSCGSTAFRHEAVDVAPHGVDGDRFQADVDPQSVAERVASSGQIESPYVLFLGTLQPRKNLGTLARAYAEARRRGLAHTLVLGGRPRLALRGCRGGPRTA